MSGPVGVGHVGLRRLRLNAFPGVSEANSTSVIGTSTDDDRSDEPLWLKQSHATLTRFH